MVFYVSRIEGKDLMIRMVLFRSRCCFVSFGYKLIMHSQFKIHEIMKLQSKASSIICIKEYVMCCVVFINCMM